MQKIAIFIKKLRINMLKNTIQNIMKLGTIAIMQGNFPVTIKKKL